MIMRLITNKNNPIDRIIVGFGFDQWSKARDRPAAAGAGAWNGEAAIPYETVLAPSIAFSQRW